MSRKRLKIYTEDEILDRFGRAFRVDYVTGILLFLDFKPIGIVKSKGFGAWNVYMVEKDLVCLWGLGISDKIPRTSWELDREYSKKFREHSRACKSKKERMKMILNLLKNYYKDIMRGCAE